MKIFSYGKDGGKDSTVWGFWLIEAKKLFSVALIVFEDGSREAYHSHAFTCVSWVLKGKLTEYNLDGTVNVYRPGFKPIITKRDTFHKVYSTGRTYVFTLRGPWVKQWKEYIPAKEEFHTLESGRKIVEVTK